MEDPKQEQVYDCLMINKEHNNYLFFIHIFIFSLTTSISPHIFIFFPHILICPFFHSIPSPAGYPAGLITLWIPKSGQISNRKSCQKSGSLPDIFAGIYIVHFDHSPPPSRAGRSPKRCIFKAFSPFYDVIFLLFSFPFFIFPNFFSKLAIPPPYHSILHNIYPCIFALSSISVHI